MHQRTLYARMIVALLALLGLLDAAYLTLNRYQDKLSLVCPIGGGCETVQSSAWSTLPPGNGIPVAVLGLLGYGALLSLGLAGLHRERIGPLSIDTALLVVAGGGVLFSIYLTGVQLFAIHALCFWCVVSALLELGIFAAAATDWLARRPRRRLESAPSRRV
jgi:uncharacterized membrane protein